MIRRLLFVLALVFVGALANPMHVAAFGALSGVNCTGSGEQSAVCTDRGNTGTDPVSGPNGLLTKAVNIISIVAGVAAVIVLLIASLKYLLSGGDSGKVGSAKSTIIYTLVGIGVLAIARTLIVFVIDKVSSGK